MRARLLVPLGAALAIVIGGAHAPPAAPPGPIGPGAGGAPPQRLAWPLGASWTETQPYGCTQFQLEPPASWCPSGHVHTGIDMAAPLGTPVHAAAAGVAHVAESSGGYGLYVTVDHGGRVATLYGHLDSTALRGGESLAAGQELGRLGSSGLSTGPHLHFEVRREGRPVDPAPWLPANP
jgi:murein DD-endopeptidase MepM/ murein hydrolase activator NlpD